MNFISCEGHTIHYSFRDHGSERNFLFINSLGTDFRIWDEVVPRLKPYGNVLLFDKRGHGLSDVAEAKNGLEDYARDAQVLLERLSIERCVVIGVSIGGMIAQILSLRKPALVEKLVLCDTAPKIGTREGWDERIASILAKGLPSVSGDLLKRWFSTGFHQTYPERIAGYKNMLERCPADGYIQACMAIRDADLTHIARQISQPVLCLAGKEDMSTSPEVMGRLASLLGNAKLEVIDDAGHLPCIDQPEEFARHIIQFLQ